MMTQYTIILLRPDGSRRHVEIEGPSDAAATLAADVLLKTQPAGTTAEGLRWPAPTVH